MIHLAQICFCNTVFDGPNTKHTKLPVAVHTQQRNTDPQLYTPENNHWNMHCTFKSHLWTDQMCTFCLTASLGRFLSQFILELTGRCEKKWNCVRSITKVGVLLGGAGKAFTGLQGRLEPQDLSRKYLPVFPTVLLSDQSFGFHFMFLSNQTVRQRCLPFLLLLLILLLCTFSFPVDFFILTLD